MCVLADSNAKFCEMGEKDAKVYSTRCILKTKTEIDPLKRRATPLRGDKQEKTRGWTLIYMNYDARIVL